MLNHSKGATQNGLMSEKVHLLEEDMNNSDNEYIETNDNGKIILLLEC